tara:strand:+ start:954 stop:1937 length:984 start_codon:yes stop_codon:yes gene_type:complete
MVGSSLIRSFSKAGYENIHATWHERQPSDLTNLFNIDANYSIKDKINWHQCNFINQKESERLLNKIKPDAVIVAAARVGGIMANNTLRSQFIYDNTQIASNIIHHSHLNNVEKLIFLGSACIYPKDAKQPIVEESLLTGLLEPTNEPYAIAKITGIKLCESYFDQYQNNFFSLMPNNLYGPGDNYNLKTSHVLPAILRKIHEAKINNDHKIIIWGSGNPRREFLHVDDLASACVFAFENINAHEIYKQKISHLNVGSGSDLSIYELAKKIKKVVGYLGEITNDLSKPDGMKQKLLDCTRMIKLGWSAKILLEDGLNSVYQNYIKSIK